MFQLTVSEKMAEELRTWAEDERAFWPKDTLFQDELSNLQEQLKPKTDETDS